MMDKCSQERRRRREGKHSECEVHRGTWGRRKPQRGEFSWRGSRCLDSSQQSVHASACPLPGRPCPGLPAHAQLLRSPGGAQMRRARGAENEEAGLQNPPSVGPPALPLGHPNSPSPHSASFPERGVPAGAICQGNVPKWPSHPLASLLPQPEREKDANSPRFPNWSSGRQGAD